MRPFELVVYLENVTTLTTRRGHRQRRHCSLSLRSSSFSTRLILPTLFIWKSTTSSDLDCSSSTPSLSSVVQVATRLTTWKIDNRTSIHHFLFELSFLPAYPNPNNYATMSSSNEDLFLDTSIRDWVLFPIMFVVFVVAIFRNNLAKYLSGEDPPTLEAIKDKHILQRVRRLRANAHLIPHSSFAMRRHYFNNTDTGVLCVVKEEDSVLDPMAMTKQMGGMKRSLVLNMHHMLVGGWVNQFFHGFIVVKLPFVLTSRFKSMFQRGIQLVALDVSYVSSLSWYILVLFGLRGINELVFESAVDETALMQQQMTGGLVGGAGGPQQNMVKVMKGEKENLTLVQYESAVAGATRGLLAKKSWTKIRLQTKRGGAGVRR